MKRCLHPFAGTPRKRLADLPLMTPEQDAHCSRRLQESGRSTNAFITRFERQVERTPDAIAVTSNDVSLTYAELNGRANAVAERLIAMGAGPDVLVALCMERSVEDAGGTVGNFESRRGVFAN